MSAFLEENAVEHEQVVQNCYSHAVEPLYCTIKEYPCRKVNLGNKRESNHAQSPFCVLQLEKEENLYRAFSHFDLDNSGYITLDELETALKVCIVLWFNPAVIWEEFIGSQSYLLCGF